MEPLLYSGNLFGLLGLVLLLVAGCRIACRNFCPGLLFICGASLIILARLYNLYLAPVLAGRVMSDFSHLQIILATEGPPFTLLVGFLLIFFGVMFLKLKTPNPGY